MMNEEVIIPLEYQLRRIADRIKTQGRSVLEEKQLSAQQFVAIQWLDEGVMTVGQLASHMGLAVSTTSEMIDQLIIKGCVRREKDTHDKRKVNLFLEQQSLDIIAEVILMRQHYLNSLMEEMSPKEQLDLGAAIAKIYTALGEN